MSNYPISVSYDDGDFLAIRHDKLDGVVAAVSGNSEFDDLPDDECKHLPEGKYLVLKVVDIIYNYKH
jgi:hypothetical protein|tara:strand:+ start:186 stop:386 length:201 start_codon:yes stop_codon:yes gene_type:complete